MTMYDDDLAIPSSGEPREAQCWAFMGAIGGSGVTSLVIQTAYSAMKKLKLSKDTEPRVCLIDLDFECGAIASYLDMPAGIKPEYLTGDAERIDSAMASAFITKHASGLRLLAAPNVLGGNDRVSPDCVLALMDAVSTMYDIIVMDVPRIWRPWTHAAIAAADKFHLVTELTIPALHMTRQRLADIEAQASLQDGVNIVLNKYERRSLRSSLSAKDAQNVLKRDMDHFICVDPETTRDAMNCGEPAGSLKPDGRYVKDVMTFTHALMDSLTETQAQAAPVKRGLFKRGAA